MDYLTQINDLFPIRRRPEQKKCFRDFILEESGKLGWQTSVEVLDGKHHNIVIGDLQTARILFSAHYDTPAASLVPNLMVPRNPLVGYLYAFGYPLVLALLSLLAATVISELFSLPYEAWSFIYILLYLGVYFLSSRTFDNRHNKNDNTSGVATVLSLMERTKGQNVAFLLFDNEEKGLLGSKAFAKVHKPLVEQKLLINLDCVGVGTHIIVIAKEGAMAHPAYPGLTASLKSGQGYCVNFFPKKGSLSNSDYKNFPCGVGIMTCRKANGLGYYTPHIHTFRDTEASSDNIEFLTNGLVEFTETT